MGLFDRLLGNEPKEERRSETRRAAPPVASANTDERALERYRYMVRTAPPETIEQAHAEAFAQLTPAQRRQILAELASAAPPGERESAQRVSPDDPQAMGRLATRTEMRAPGFMERAFGGGGFGGGGVGGSLFGTFAMGFLGSMVANSFFSSLGGLGSESLLADDAATAHEGDVATTEDTNQADVAEGEYAGDVEESGFDDGGFDGDLGGGDFDV